jgi:hypothetical protein
VAGETTPVWMREEEVVGGGSWWGGGRWPVTRSLAFGCERER